MSGKKIIMNEKHVIRCVMTLCGESLKHISSAIGISAGAFSAQLGRTDSTMTLTSVFAALRAMGFEVVVRDKDGKHGGIEYIIDEIEPDSPKWIKQAAAEKADAEIRFNERKAAARAEIERQHKEEVNRRFGGKK